MILAMTMMVRDEADIIAATIEHHLAQGVDRIIVTDNASIDGTREILDEYAALAPVTVLHDSEHRKQQAEVVTRMARQAFTEFGADWVINGDADEFVRPLGPTLTLHDVFDRMPKDLGAFTVPVINMVGKFARSGAGFERLVLRDERPIQVLNDAGVLAHPTPNAIHVGDADVEVAQGNHFVSIEQDGEVPAGLELEVLHLPWRSWAQIARKTESMGRGYEANPGLRPSANHHGMRDWRRLRAGALEAFLARRMPISDELAASHYRRDDSLLQSLRRLEPIIPERLHASLDGSADDAYSDTDVDQLRAMADTLAPLDDAAQADIVVLRHEVDARNSELYEERMHVAALDASLGEVAEREQQLAVRAMEQAAMIGALEGSLSDARTRAAASAGEGQMLRVQLDEIRRRRDRNPVVRVARGVRRRLAR